MTKTPSKGKAQVTKIADKAQLTPCEERMGRHLVDSVHKTRDLGLPYYSDAERMTVAILRAELSRQQSIKGKKGRAKITAEVDFRRQRVNILLRYVIPQTYRDDPTSEKTVMYIVDFLDSLGMEASNTQVRRDIKWALKQYGEFQHEVPSYANRILAPLPRSASIIWKEACRQVGGVD
ncbi:MAG: hypothetical protein GY788_32315 [bacterium]|nr:hypothetical protein [bacterium]